MSSISECDEPTELDTLPEYLHQLTTDTGGFVIINDNLTADLSNFVFPPDVSEGKICGNVRVVLALKSTSSGITNIHGTKSLQINVKCHSNENQGDIKITASYSSTEIPVVEVGDENPFGQGSQVTVDYGNCYSPKAMACLYCGFDEGRVGVDDETWDTWQTIEVYMRESPLLLISKYYSFIFIGSSLHITNLL